MKTTRAQYAFSKSEMRILKEVAKREHSFLQIEEALSIKPSLLSYNLRQLLNKGIIKVTEKGSRKYVRFNDSKHAYLLKDLLLVYDYIDWQNILSGKAVEILFHTLAESGKSLDNFSRATLWRYRKTLRAHGIVIQEKGEYKINPRFSLLTNFLDEYQRFFINMLADSMSENAAILWQRDMEFLVRTPKNVKSVPKNFLKTATSLFPDFGIPIFSEYDIYFYSTEKKNIRLEDTILHTLLIEPNNVRYTIYALLLLKKHEERIDKQYLTCEAEKVGRNRLVNGMLVFLRTRTPSKDLALPTWQEFETRARDYRVIE
jgi:DNA-binding transcriptional ArsR family regulator